ncbi:NHL domain-containing protein [Streptomonospora wellingtoniae]|uniref:Teneurin NHL domain-containing protein n=1 Tax=Streptomonospora wellingtoniae TaxID=3075544 RepID=A0ABU2KV34_9ACTN|nr:hypothetical protein [Streptomonospora sp. DSM 45055]MDT0303144.1 hypothetical protein [Streptomonospora sp. DSM 45055]
MPLGRSVARCCSRSGAVRAGAHRRICALVLAALVLAPAGCAAPTGTGRPGTVETVVGTGKTGWIDGGYGGDAGDARSARLNAPRALAFSADGTLYIADTDNNRIRSVDPDSNTVNTVAGGGSKDWAGATSATDVALPEVTDLAVDSYGDTLYIAAMLENQVAAVDLTDGSIEILAGRDDGKATDMREREAKRLRGLWWPSGVAVGPDETLYIADSGNGRVIAVGPHRGRGTGHPHAEHIRVVAGNGAAAPDAGPWNGGTPPGGGFGELGRLAVGGDGSVYFVDATLGLRKIDGYDNTVSPAWNPDLPADPEALAVAAEGGTLYAADTARNRVLAYVPGRREPIVVAGTGTHGFSGDGGPARQAALDSPGGLAISPRGDLYIADTHNHRIRVVYDVAAAVGELTD